MHHLLLPLSLFSAGLALGAGGASLLSPSAPPPAPPPASGRRVEELPAPVRPGQVAGKSATPALGGVEAARVREILGHSGHPGPIFDELSHLAFVAAYDRRLRHPAWTAEHLTAASLIRPPVTPGSGQVDRANSVFKEDERIPLPFRARLKDYFRSGYDRGHMVPAADAKSSQLAMNETFYLSNIAPQVGEGFNRDYWAHLEDFCRRLTARFADVYVFTIPLYLPRQEADGKWRVSYEMIGNPPAIAVPTHFAKVILASGRPGATAPSLPAPAGPSSSTTAPPPLPGVDAGTGGRLLSTLGLGNGVTALGAFVLPNAIIPNSVPLRAFEVPLETVERAAGLELFPPHVKSGAKALCGVTDCSIIVREFNKTVGERTKPERRNSA